MISNGYNNRLFSRAGLRRIYHLARFKWVRDKVAKLPWDLKLVELGCYDGRLLDTLGERVSEYVGIDANWEGGLDIAREKFADRSNVRLIHATDPTALSLLPDNHFNVAAALETLEHVPADLVGPYLDELGRITHGHLFVSVPNELGPIFLIKYLAKRLFYGAAESYRFAEVIAATMRRSDKVQRYDHKGFDYRDVVREVQARFEVLAVEGLPRTGLPPALSPTVAIYAKSRGAVIGSIGLSRKTHQLGNRAPQ